MKLPRIAEWKLLAATLVMIFFVAVLLSALPASPQPQAQAQIAQSAHEVVLSLDPAQTKLHWTVDTTLHLVHGTFAVKGGSVHFDPATGKAGGEIIVMATSGDSENSSRDERMHKEILESAKYPDVIFRPTQVEGKIASSGGSEVKVHGVFSLHGAQHDLVAPVHVEIAGDHWKGTTKFEVPYIQWGLKDPSNFLLKVKPVVNVELEMSGTTGVTHP
jgi:polyisoprenoid-binding protein YceI